MGLRRSRMQHRRCLLLRQPGVARYTVPRQTLCNRRKRVLQGRLRLSTGGKVGVSAYGVAAVAARLCAPLRCAALVAARFLHRARHFVGRPSSH